MLLSGSIGVVILKKNNKIIYLLSDDHSNNIYCSNNSNNHSYIHTFLESEINKGNQILLEEVYRDGFNLKELWTTTKHTQDLKNLFLTNKNINGIDIRPYLLPFSWIILDIDKPDSEICNMSIKQYISKLDDFFNCSGYFFQKIFKPVYKSILIKNSGSGKHLYDAHNLYKKIISYNDLSKSIYFYFQNKKNILYDIDTLCDMIMEFYTILLSFTSCKKSYIHAGLFHSHNILDYLIKHYNFNIIYKNGTVTFPPYLSKINACTLLPTNNSIY